MASGIIAIVGTVLSSLLPLAVRLITAWLNKNSEDKELKKKWYSFIESLESSVHVPAKLRDSASRQRKRLDDMLAEIDKKEEVREGTGTGSFVAIRSVKGLL